MDALKGDIRHQVNGNIARLAGVLPDGNEKISRLLVQLAGDNGTNKIKWHDEKLAFVLGWTIQKATLKELVGYNQKLVKSKHQIEEIRQYQDTQLVKMRFGKQPAENISGEQFSSLMLQLIARVVTRIHTLTPDKKDGGAWILRVAEWRGQNKKTMELYGNAIQNPDQDKLNLYVKKCKLFDYNDPLITGQFHINGLEKDNHSLYSRSIVQGYNAVLAVQSFLDGKSEVSTVMKYV